MQNGIFRFMRYVDQFMFSYQPSFRIGLEILARNVFAAIGIDSDPRVLLIGARRPQVTTGHPVCLEPEDDEWTVEPFQGLLEAIEGTILTHPLQSMFFDDEASMREKPENIRRSSVTMSIKAALAASDIEHRRRSFCGLAVAVGSYYVVPVLQMSTASIEQCPPLPQPHSDDSRIPTGFESYAQACIAELLDEAEKELGGTQPGRGGTIGSRKAEEIARTAAKYFMRTPAYMISRQWVPGDLFERLNLVSSLMYEGVHGAGQLILAAPHSEAVEFIVRFDTPVPFREPRWARKILQMASKDVALIADSEVIYGLGRLKKSDATAEDPVFVIDFLDHYSWEIQFRGTRFFASRFGEPSLPRDPISRERFIDNFSRLFPDAPAESQEHMWTLFRAAVRQKHGSMIVVADDAESEARRLAKQGTVIEATLLTAELFERASGIDGTILINPAGVCHAIGVILDGAATEDCMPSRGSRFNSGVRYVSSGEATRFAIVVSEDRTVDVFPLLRPQIHRSTVDKMVAALESANSDNYHRSRNWLNKNRFYLSAAQCARANAALLRIEKSMERTRSIIVEVAEFSPAPGLNDAYFVAE